MTIPGVPPSEGGEGDGSGNAGLCKDLYHEAIKFDSQRMKAPASDVAPLMAGDGSFESFKSFKEGKKVAEDRTAVWLTNCIASIQASEVLCRYAILYLFKDVFLLHPHGMSYAQGIIQIPWVVKPLWALFADCTPIFGYRRKAYIVIGSSIAIVSMVLMGLVGCKNMYGAIALLSLFLFGAVLCNVIGEALLVERGRMLETDSAAMSVSEFFGIRALAFLLMSYLSGVLLLYMSKEHLFLLSAIIPIPVLVLALLFEESPCEDPPPVKEQLKTLKEVVSHPVLSRASLFMLIFQMTPSYGNVLFYFETNVLRLNNENMGRIALFGSAASAAGIYLYRRFLVGMKIRSVLFWSTLATVPFSLLPIILVYRWNHLVGIPDLFFLVADTAVMDAIGQIQTLPLLVLSAFLCPPGLECTIYSFLLSMNNFGGFVSPLISGLLTDVLGVKHDFKNFVTLITICSFSSLIPLLLLRNLPDDDSRGRRIEEEMSKSGSLVSSQFSSVNRKTGVEGQPLLSEICHDSK